MKAGDMKETTADFPHSVVYLIGRTNEAVWQLITRKTQAIGGITGMQASLLLLLTSRHDMRSTDLAREYDLSASVVSRLVDHLARIGLVARVPSERDRRVIYLRITSAGRKTASRLPPIFAQAFDTLLDGMEERDVDTLGRCLRHILLKARAEVSHA